jgi:hypothetical protein
MGLTLPAAEPAANLLGSGGHRKSVRRIRKRFRWGDSFMVGLRRQVLAPHMMESRSRFEPVWVARRLFAWVVRARGYVVLLAGLVVVAFGSWFYVVRFPGPAIAPVLLLVLGAALLTSAVGYLAGERTVAPPRADAPERYIADTLVICPSCSARQFAGEAGDDRSSASWRVPHPPIPEPFAGTGGTIDVDPGESLWGIWGPDPGRLAIDRIGAVPATVPVRGPSNSLSPRQGGEPATLAPDDPDPAPRSWTSGAVLDPPRPIDVIPSSAELGNLGSRAPSARTGGSGTDLAAVETPVADPVLREALNPTPPHRRTGSKRPEAMPRAGVPRSASGSAYQCAECQAPVLEALAWRRCTDCREPLCADCLVDALLTRERAWCSRCTDRRALAP